MSVGWGQCPTIIQGDINQDNTLDILDIVWTINIIMDGIEISDEMFDIVDINDDEIINILDIVIILNRILDNTPPTQIDILSIEYDISSMTFSWNQSTDNDFSCYTLLMMVDGENEQTELYSTDDISDTTYSTVDFDPLVQTNYQLKVSDVSNNSSVGEVYQVLEEPPTQLELLIEYTLDELTLTWEESPDDDFIYYSLYFSETETGDKVLINSFYSSSNTSYSITGFDPTIERWYWVEVTDWWGLSSVSEGFQVFDSPPTPSTLNPIEYENGSFNISWSQNTDDDFNSYILYESFYESMDDYNVIFSTEDINTLSFSRQIDTGQIKFYQLIIKDFLGLESSSEIEMGDSWIDFVRIYDGGIYMSTYHSQQTLDGGYIISGVRNGSLWLHKTDSIGNEVWDQFINEGQSWESSMSVQQTFDGGFIILTGKWFNLRDIMLIKTDSNGTQEWNQIIGGSGQDEGYFVQQTTDGGYIIIGSTNSYCNYCTWLFKTDSEGTIEWNQFIGESGSHSVQQTTDGGFIILGGPGLIKTDSLGNEEWRNTEIFSYSVGSVQQTTDGGFIIGGGSGLIKTDSLGNEEWRNTEFNNYRSVKQTTDGGFILIGGGMLIKTDLVGNEEWTYSPNEIGLQSVGQNNDGSYIIGGFNVTDFFDGLGDIILIKTNPF